MHYEFWIMTSISELVHYPDEWKDEYIPHPNFKTIMDAIGIRAPIEDIYERYFNQPVHTGHVLVFSNKHEPGTCIVFDTYRDAMDQSDMIRFGWRISGKEAIESVKQLSRRLYDECEDATIFYKEGQCVLYEVLKEERYPRKIYYKKVFKQQIKRYIV
ncbi:hypothetical protein ABNX05_02210 [Lysinibacillus sp. M3]|uniref:Uncharacterized protein n=1 Tax=Lysinibacillus zambalensis TaxID=3160866 RepID=A0ABV1MNF9_9BACI